MSNFMSNTCLAFTVWVHLHVYLFLSTLHIHLFLSTVCVPKPKDILGQFLDICPITSAFSELKKSSIRTTKN